MLLRSTWSQLGAASSCAHWCGQANGKFTRSAAISSSASAAAKVGCSTSEPPAASVAPSDIPKLPDQKKPLADQHRTWSSGPKPYMRRKRHIWMQTPRCALRMPFGLLVDPDEKNSTAASLGCTAAAVASTSSRGSSRPLGQEVVPGFDAGRGLADHREPAQERVLRGLQRPGATRDLRLQLGHHGREVLLQHAALEQQHRNTRGSEQIVELCSRRERAERDGHATGHRDAEHRRDPFRPVRHQHAHAGALADAARAQRTRHLDRPLPEFGIGPARDTVGRAEDESLALAVHRRHFAQEARQRERPEPRLVAQAAVPRRSDSDCHRSDTASSTSAVQSTSTVPSWLVRRSLT